MRAVARAVVITTVTVMPVFLVGGLAVQISGELHFSPAGLGTAVALYFGTSALTALPSGWLVERYGAAVASRAGILLSAASMLAIAVAARSYLTLVVLLMLGAGANALGQLASNDSLANQVPPHRQGLSFGAKQAAIPLATLVAGATVPTVALTVGWRWAFVLAAVLAVAALVMAPGRAGEPGRTAKKATGERATAALVVLGSAAALGAGTANALGAFLVTSAVYRGVGAASAGAMLTLGSAVGVCARVAGGWLADRRSGGHIVIVAAMLAVGAVGLALLAVPSSWALVVGTTLGFGLGWSWAGVLNFAVVRLNPSAPASATAITQSGVYIGGFVGPIGFGFLAAHWSYAVAWLVAAAFMVVAAGLMITGRRMLLAHPHTRGSSRSGPTARS
jgi:MFS family permease